MDFLINSASLPLTVTQQPIKVCFWLQTRLAKPCQPSRRTATSTFLSITRIPSSSAMFLHQFWTRKLKAKFCLRQNTSHGRLLHDIGTTSSNCYPTTLPSVRVGCITSAREGLPAAATANCWCFFFLNTAAVVPSTVPNSETLVIN